MTKTTTLTVRVDPALKERLEGVARRLNRSKSFIAGDAIAEYVAVQEWQIARIEQAMTSIDDGKGVAHEDVVRWIKSWNSDDELPMPKA